MSLAEPKEKKFVDLKLQWYSGITVVVMICRIIVLSANFTDIKILQLSEGTSIGVTESCGAVCTN